MKPAVFGYCFFNNICAKFMCLSVRSKPGVWSTSLLDTSSLNLPTSSHINTSESLSTEPDIVIDAAFTDFEFTLTN